MRITLFGYFPSDFWASFYGPDAVGRLECSFLGGPGTPPLVLKEAVRKAPLLSLTILPSLSRLELHTDYDIAHPVLSEYKKTIM